MVVLASSNRDFFDSLIRVCIVGISHQSEEIMTTHGILILNHSSSSTNPDGIMQIWDYRVHFLGSLDLTWRTCPTSLGNAKNRITCIVARGPGSSFSGAGDYPHVCCLLPIHVHHDLLIPIIGMYESWIFHHLLACIHHLFRFFFGWSNGW